MNLGEFLVLKVDVTVIDGCFAHVVFVNVLQKH